MNIIDKIHKLPPDMSLPGIGDGTYGFHLPTNDLHALAESHERLLAAAQPVASNLNLVHEIVGLESLVDGQCYCSKCRLTEAIEQAEKL